MTLDKNTFPYYDDFTESKNYYQILFRPGRAVQARELSQIQSQIQKQIERFGNHVFKEGSMVIPGEMVYDNAFAFVKIEDQFNSADVNIQNFLNRKVIGTDSGAVATVLMVEETTGVDPKTFYLHYETGDSELVFTASIGNGNTTVSGANISVDSRLVIGAAVAGAGIPANTYITEILNDSEFVISNAATNTNSSATITVTTSSKFADDETLITLPDDNNVIEYSAQSIAVSATGVGSKAALKSGVFYANGYFCFVDDQTIILSKYTNTPSFKVGLNIVESFVSEQDDFSLVDPAAGTPNANAPGAHRYKIELVLVKYNLDDVVSDSFIELLRVKDGIVQKLVTRPEYSELEKTLARRTYDESGDYTVRSFPLAIREHLNSGSNLGLFAESSGGDESKFVYIVEPGKAYVRGYEIELQSSINLEIEKARDTLFKNNQLSSPTLGSFINIDNVSGTFNISSYETVDLMSGNSNNDVIGTARVRGFDFVSGTPGQTSARYRLYLFDINMLQDSNGAPYSFSSVTAVEATSGAKANIILDNGFATLYNPVGSAPIVVIPEIAVKSLKNETTNTDTSYTTKRRFTGALIGTSVTLTAGTDEVFNAFTVLSYHVSVSNPSATAISNGFTVGSVVDLTTGGASVVLGGSPTGKQVTLTIPLIEDSEIEIIATVTKTNAIQKTKTLTTRTQNGLAHSDSVQLDRADVYRVVSVTDATTTEVITDRYLLDNGQRDSYYDRGRLIFNTNFAPPVGNINVVYEYFEHGAGDFFTVDSYDGVVPYGEIPGFFSSTGTFYDLINCIDFRPRINNAGNGFSVTSEFVSNGEQLIFDYEYFVPRFDKIVLSNTGEFSVVKGASGVNPQLPKTPENSMVLYEVFVPPFTFSAQDVSAKRIDNRRYTMRDIGGLEKRITNLEYYTALSLLEKDTADMFIDDGTGANRFKNGFVVDNFKTRLGGDTQNIDHACSIDIDNGILRPQFSADNVRLSLNAGLSSGYTQTGDLITLPFTTEVLIDQPFASKTENVNPYNVFNWIGGIKMSPSSDDWFEVNQLPDIIINNEDEYQRALATQNGTMIWDEWTTSWVGKEVRVAATSNGNPFTGTTAGGESGIWGSASRQYWATQLITQAGIDINTLQNVQTQWSNGWAIVTGQQNTLVAKEVGQVRTGTMTTVVPGGTSETILGERIIDTSFVPWIRENTIHFDCENLKPNTRLYPFFDGVNVSQFVRPDDSNSTNGDPLITNNNGFVSGFFDIPNTSTLRFRTGQREFKLIDSESNNVNLATTTASGTYAATGVLQTKQATVQSTRLFELVQSTIQDSRITTITELESRDISLRRYVDPVAQTFLIDNPDGAFVSSIEIFFATKDAAIPVQLQIRTTINGVPGQHIVPLSTVTLNPDSVNVSEDGSVGTSFTFESPVYLNGGVEYCFVLLSNSNDYNLWCSKLGEFDAITGERISQQPYAGVMFKSSNASTWTPDQEQDIKFKMNRCVFDTSATGSIVFENVPVSKQRMIPNPFFTTDSVSTINVIHPNHGLRNGDTVTFTGVSGTHNGIPASDLNDSFTIVYVDVDNYQIEFDSNKTLPNASGICGGNTVIATKNLRMDVANIMIQNMSFPNAPLSFGVRTRSVSGTLASQYANVSALENVVFSNPRIVLGEDNSSGNSSLLVRGTMQSATDWISPVIDTDRLSAVIVSNRINNDFTDEEITGEGKAIAKYVTKRVVLSTPATGTKVFLTAQRPVNGTIKVFFKYKADANQAETFGEQDYIEMIPEQYPSGSGSDFREYVFTIDELEDFSMFAVKVVLLSDSTTDIPLIKDFRAIAVA